MIKRMKSLKIRTQLILLILSAGLIAFSLFHKLWLHKWAIAQAITGKNYAYTELDDMDFMDELYEAAKAYDLPESEEDTNAVAAIEPFLEMPNEYTSIYIYGREDGLYRAGRFAPIMEQHDFRLFFDAGYRLSDGEGEDTRMFPLKFRNDVAMVMMTNYERTLFTYPYMAGCLFLSILLFFLIILFFFNRKIRSVLILEREVLTMSSGDLAQPVPNLGGDEIGILARELNHLRITLSDNIAKEQASHKANQDLITALSHDLRTPLTILTGYLEVLRLKRNPEVQEEYVERCLKKAEDIKDLTDRMFEYALVSEENEVPEFTWISTDFIEQCLVENCDFIRLAGFTPSLLMPDDTHVLESDKTMLKRILNNLFSNILKYGDKKQPITIVGKAKKQTLMITVTNTVRKEHSQSSSNNIGLNNVQKMTRLLGGEMKAEEKDDRFTVTISLPLK